MSQVETLEFQAEAKQVLDLMIHSLYTNKEIFLRELISNASDALDRLRVESLTHPNLLGKDDRFEIVIEADKDQRTLTVHDSGIGMSREEVIAHIGTIAKSGTRELLQTLKENSHELAAKLIGQFGVGFYSVFMAADRVTLLTRRAGQEKGVEWASTGDGAYTIREADKFRRGTSITLHLKPPDADAGLEDFADEWVVRRIVKQYSDFVTYPITFQAAGAAAKKDAEDKPINSMRPIWSRPAAEVTEDEYKEFYRHISHDWNEPLRRFSFQAEGRIEYRALVYLPSEPPMDLFFEGGRFGLQLYVRQVLIMENCEDLLPRHLRFVKGIVDSSDLPLNISRQRLQEDRHIAQIRKWIGRKVIDALADLAQNDRAAYDTFWRHFGKVLKEGVAFDPENKDRILPLLEFDSSHDPEKRTTLADYVARMQPGQNEIFYLTGDTRELIAHSPHLEAFRARQLEVLFLSDPIDELVVQALPEFEGKKLKSVGKGVVALGAEEEQNEARKELNAKQPQFLDLMSLLKQKLDRHVKQVRLTNRLTDSPACLVVAEEDLSPQLERILRAQGRPVPPQPRILELNPEHEIVQRLKTLAAQDPTAPLLDDYAELLYGGALIAEGSELPEPARFNRALNRVLAGTMS